MEEDIDIKKLVEVLIQLNAQKIETDKKIFNISNVLEPGKLRSVEYNALNQIDYNFFQSSKNIIKSILLNRLGDTKVVEKKLNLCLNYLKSTHKAIFDCERKNIDVNVNNIRKYYGFVTSNDINIKQEIDCFNRILINGDVKIGKVTYTDDDFCSTMFFNFFEKYKSNLGDEKIVKDLYYIKTIFPSEIVYSDNVFKLHFLRWVNQYSFYEENDKFDALISLIDEQKKDFLVKYIHDSGKIIGENLIKLPFDELADRLLDMSGFEYEIFHCEKNSKIDWGKIKNDFDKKFQTNVNIAELRINYILQFKINGNKINNTNYFKDKINFFKKYNKFKFYLAQHRKEKGFNIEGWLKEYNKDLKKTRTL